MYPRCVPNDGPRFIERVSGGDAGLTSTSNCFSSDARPERIAPPVRPRNGLASWSLSASDPSGQEKDVFTICLEFLADCCPSCGVPREPGLCPRCGVEVGESDEVAEIAKARAKALESLDLHLQELVERFGALPDGNIVVTNDQFATAVSDAEIFQRLGEMTSLGAELEALDVNDRTVVGGKLRKAMEGRVAQVEALLATCEELSLFDPQGPAQEFRTVAAQSGRYGAKLTQAFMKVLVAETIPVAREAGAEMQELLHGFPYGKRISELAEEMEAWIVPDFDARAALVLGRPGRYSDDYGFLDAGAVFGAFADQEAPFHALAECARRYFSHLIGAGPVREVGIESFLIVPAVGLATLDRPLGAHRISRSLYGLLDSAATADAEAVQRLVDRTITESELIFHAVEQIRRGFKLLAAGEEAGLADDAVILKTIMDSYKELAETSFRTYGWLVVDLEKVKNGEALSQDSTPPTMGTLTAQLEASRELVAQQLAASSDSALRNACGHAQYRWDALAEEVHDMRTDQRWSLENLELSVESMGSAIAGADAGYICFLASGRAELKKPEWAGNGPPGLLAQVADATFSARGFRVIELQDQGRTVLISFDDTPEMFALMSTLGGMTTLAGDDDVVRVLDQTGQPLLDVEVAAFREASEAPLKFKDLAIMAPFFSNAARTTGDRDRALFESLVLLANQVSITLVEDAERDDFGASSMLKTADRLGYVIDFARARGGAHDEETKGLMRRLARCRSFAFRAAQNAGQAGTQFMDEFRSLSDWISTREIVWPPQL